MKSFKLNIGALIQGTSDVKAVNIAFVFQVNCPGCFIYGFPMMNRLYQQFKNQIGFIGISTAFEDFEHNNVENTQLLLSKGATVGETKKYLSSQGQATYSSLPEFPIAFDKMSTPKDFLSEENIDTLISVLSGSRTLTEVEKKSFKQRIRDHYMSHSVIPESFVINQLRGTPSFIIFNENFEILHSSFGHQPEEQLNQLLQDSLSKNQ